MLLQPTITVSFRFSSRDLDSNCAITNSLKTFKFIIDRLLDLSGLGSHCGGLAESAEAIHSGRVVPFSKRLFLSYFFPQRVSDELLQRLTALSGRRLNPSEQQI